MDIIHNIDHDPEHGAGITFTWMCLALLINFFVEFQIITNDHVNPIIMDIFQLGAWAVAILVGTFTGISYIKKWFFKSR